MPLFKSGKNLIHFIHIPKTGGSSIENALANLTGIKMALQTGKNEMFKVTPQHMDKAMYKKVIPKNFVDWHFTVVRNPYSRILSEYKMKVLAVDNVNISLDDFIEQSISRCKVYPYTRDNHIRPQVDFVANFVEVFKLEDGLENPIKMACRYLNVKSTNSIPHSRKIDVKPIKINKKTVNLISTFYEKDFHRFKYDPDTLPSTLI